MNVKTGEKIMCARILDESEISQYLHGYYKEIYGEKKRIIGMNSLQLMYGCSEEIIRLSL